MQPTPRAFTQKGILQFLCKIAGVLFILQTFFTLQKILSVEWIMNSLSQGNLALTAELLTNVAVCWVFFTKSDWIAEKLEVGSDEIRVSIGKQELLEIVIIAGGLVLVVSAASRIFESLVGYVYLSSRQDIAIPIDEMFSGLFMLGIGFVLLKYHKRVFSFVSNLRETDHSE